MNRKKFISGLVALGATPAAAGSLLSILPAHAEDGRNGSEAKERASTLEYTADEITDAGANFFGITTEAMARACSMCSATWASRTLTSRAMKAAALSWWASAMARVG